MEYMQLTFLTKLFSVAALYLTEMHPDKVYVDEPQLALDWRNYLDADDRRIRKELYARAVRASTSPHATMMWAILTSVLLQEAETEFDDIKYGGEWTDAAQGTFSRLKRTARSDGPDVFLSAIESRLPHGLRHPEIAALVYVDEAHELARVSCHPSDAINAYTTFTYAFHHLSQDRPIFLVAMSTDPVIRNNGTSFPRFQEPFTELVFDCSLDGEPFFKRGTMTLHDVAQDDFMVKFGRPMYVLHCCTRWCASHISHRFSTRWKASFEFAGPYVRESILVFALVKLTCCDIAVLRESYHGRYFYGRTVDQEAKMAAIGTRLSVDFNRLSPGARELEAGMVAANMRVAFSIPHSPADWCLQTGTPSEPLLAEAAAWFMNKFFDKAKVVEQLHFQLERDRIQPDPRGGLVARALLIFAHDQATVKISRGYHVRYCTAVPVLAFLKELFAERWHADILSTRPDMAAEGSKTLEEAFSGAFVRFSHFVKNGEGQPLNVFTALAAVARGMAFRRTEKHADYDIAIPVVMEDSLLDAHLMTYILIRLNYQHYSPPSLDPSIIAEIFPGLGTNPYILINMHLAGVDQHACAAYRDAGNTAAGAPSPHPQHPGYRFTIAGCSEAIFAVIDDKSMCDRLAPLLQLHTPVGAFEEAELARVRAKGSAKIRQRMKFHWDRGPASYDWIDGPVLHQECSPANADKHEFVVVHG